MWWATLFGICALTLSGSGASAQGLEGANLREERLRPGETGTAWIEEGFGGLLAIESILVRPPDTVFLGRAQRLVVKLLEEDGGWTTVMDLPVNPEAAQDSATWPRISLAPKIPPEMEAAYAGIREAMKARGRSEPESFGYYLEAAWRPSAPYLARGVRFEMVGPNALGTGWTLQLKTDHFASKHGSVSQEWRYTHAW